MILDKISFDIFNCLKENNIFVEKNNIQLQRTQQCFSGDFTFVLFDIKKKYNIDILSLGNILGTNLLKNKLIKDFQVIKGYLNLSLNDSDIFNLLNSIFYDENFFNFKEKNETILVEYSSPNTNKPLHLGHLRNIFLGYSTSKLLRTVGYNVKAVTLVNDRGMHICKSMLAYLKQGNNTTPYTEHVKGDHFVGDYYVAFENLLKKQKKELNISEDKDTPLMQEVQDMLEKWEKKDSEVINLWKTMNTWVLEGFEETYKKLGISFDKVYYESETYLLGKEIVQEGLEKNIFYKKKDGSVWINLNDVHLDEKLLLRANGTSVYITQDLGTIELRQKEFNPKKTIYVVGDEQEYHFKVLKNIVKKLKRDYEIYHLSYGMIDLPSGRMKSREGTVVDADDIINEMIDKVKEKTMENNKINNISIAEQDSLFEKIGLAALKFYLLKVNPKKRITFDPNKSIDFQGDTGTFILYTYVRINSILHKINNNNICLDIKDYTFLDVEKNIIFEVSKYKNIIIESVEKLDISILSQYVLGLSKMYNKFYDCCTILNEKDICKRSIRLSISKLVIRILKHSLNILGINTVDKM